MEQIDDVHRSVRPPAFRRSCTGAPHNPEIGGWHVHVLYCTAKPEFLGLLGRSLIRIHPESPMQPSQMRNPHYGRAKF